MTGLEYGNSGSWKSPFPAEWGRPPGDPYSETRAQWVKAKVRRRIAVQSLQEMRQRQVRVLNLLRREYVERLGDDAP